MPFQGRISTEDGNNMICMSKGIALDTVSTRQLHLDIEEYKVICIPRALCARRLLHDGYVVRVHEEYVVILKGIRTSTNSWRSVTNGQIHDMHVRGDDF